MYPWETMQGMVPWQLVDPIFPRIIAIHRSATVAGTTDTPIGYVGYSGREQDAAPTDPQGELVLFTGLPAAIEAKSEGRTKGTTIPTDVIFKPSWKIYIPSSALSQYSVRDRDIIVDDEGYRYMVSQNYWTTFGYELSTVRMES